MRNETEARKLADKAIKKIDRLEDGESIEIFDKDMSRKLRVTIELHYIYSENIWIATYETELNGKKEIIHDEEMYGFLVDFFKGE